MNTTGAKVRAVAAEITDAVVSGGQSLDAAIARNETRVVVQDRSLLRMLCYGSLRHHWRLQGWIDQLISKPLRQRDRVINALLAIGLYQIAEMRIPDHAVVSATVEAARQLRRPKLAGLVNACLRRFVRDGLMATEPADAPSEWNHPPWLIERIRTDWPDDWRTILTANNERAPMWLRVNSSRVTAEEYLQRLQESGAEADLLAGIPDAVRLKEPQAVENLPGFAAGDASVQDAAAQLAARWLLHDLLPHKATVRVLDACAAPGGKSGHLLEIGGEAISLLAVDSDATRVASISNNLQRLGRDASILTADVSQAEEWWDGEMFDGILLDAPCSASGVIRRHPDIKLLRREGDVVNLAACQRSMLEALWPTLVVGGTLLYATCSVIAAENDEVISDFLAAHSDAAENDVLPNNNIRDLMRRRARGYQILPGTAGLDGFYYAALRKKKVSSRH
jgi:16S rRNA (cytosine967-C5)-methyltransferase